MKTLLVQFGLGDDSMTEKFDAEEFNASIEHGKMIVKNKVDEIILCACAPQMFYEIINEETKDTL